MINEINSRNELADFLEISRSRLTYLLYVKHIDSMYTSFEIPKKSGGTRSIHAPNKELKLIQSRLASKLYEYRLKLKKNIIIMFPRLSKKRKVFLQMQRCIERNGLL